MCVTSTSYQNNAEMSMTHLRVLLLFTMYLKPLKGFLLFINGNRLCQINSKQPSKRRLTKYSAKQVPTLYYQKIKKWCERTCTIPVNFVVSAVTEMTGKCVIRRKRVKVFNSFINYSIVIKISTIYRHEFQQLKFV